ncbi:MarR family winged helix-turn-helix transcriptional regulator [Microbacterium maritypicum]|uniref:MarR family winged helix-turn-helix transcriptional regulator n=1 Tax=Microbacterium maritypicum TaxID=33918 RepID=UPI0037FE30C7
MAMEASGNPVDGARDAFADLTEVVLRVARELSYREHRESRGISLTPANANIMRHIDRNPGTTPSEVADATGVFRSNLSTALRELERLGFVERRSDPEDGRGVCLFSTDAAARNLDLIRESWSESARIGLADSEGILEATALLEGMATKLVAARRQNTTS